MSRATIGAEERRERNGLDSGDPDEDVYLGDACYHVNPYCRQGIDVSETVPRRTAQRQYAACFGCILKDYGRDDIGSAANLVDLDSDADGPTARSKRRRDCLGQDGNGDTDDGRLSIDQDGKDVDFYRARALRGASDATIRSCLKCIGPTPQRRQSADAGDVWECLECGNKERTS